MSATITLYDIPSKIGVWSPNVTKIRYVLNYKKIPFTTVWVEYPAIAGLYKELDLPAKDKHQDGSPYYTLPIISDPSTGTVICDSFDIAVYLEKNYPSAHSLFPIPANQSQENDIAFQRSFQDTFEPIIVPLYGIILSSLVLRLNPESAAFREKSFGGTVTLEELSPKGPVRDAHLDAEEKAFGAWLRQNGVTDEQKYVLGEGDRLTYVDFILSAWMLFIRNVTGSESDDWRTIEGWNGGRWARLVEDMDGFTNV